MSNNHTNAVPQVSAAACYYVEENWSHIHSCGNEWDVRFVLSVATGACIAMDQRLPEVTRWMPAPDVAEADVLESLGDNKIFDDLEAYREGETLPEWSHLQPENFTAQLPEWAQ